MRIVNRAEFLSLPANTVYVKYDKHYGLSQIIEIKASTPEDGWGDDFVVNHLSVFVEDPYSDIDVDFEKINDTFRFEINQTIRDGLFEADQLFAVFDNEDVERVINKLKACLK